MILSQHGYHMMAVLGFYIIIHIKQNINHQNLIVWQIILMYYIIEQESIIEH